MEETMKRDQLIVRTSIIGIVANLFLAAFKAAVGLLSRSIAVTLDAVNNLSDALSSVITIIGTKIANRQPDKKHPLGHGRTEYLSAMIVAAIVLYAGVTSLVESIKKIIHPETPDYSVVSLIIIASAVAVKLILGRYVKAQGQKANSGALIASGEDARFDAILSASVLASAVIFLLTGLSLEAWVGVTGRTRNSRRRSASSSTRSPKSGALMTSSWTTTALTGTTPPSIWSCRMS